MKNDPKFKDWLKKNYSCFKCNKEFFRFIPIEHIQIFYYCRSEVEPWSGFYYDGERICFDCYKKTIDKNDSSPYIIGICATEYIQKIYEVYQIEEKGETPQTGSESSHHKISKSERKDESKVNYWLVIVLVVYLSLIFLVVFTLAKKFKKVK